ncbi:PREDICTED: uncharacterized protein LOC109584031 [Amphimedon queenslandica]|uniref:Uncharacterized protein n=2 Tax=Amphimedon queenslandica TaxID=400682 RepID=A0AAN0JEG2_AMPQE|nr:PREDICTED: uncharacterized protein LOC109584031 [Amphimedon queenslandica]|eukprot:XP_019855152.1 PREDICTED: uncharacterized protein LOC109584031 [Amphimedon queenslandica]
MVIVILVLTTTSLIAEMSRTQGRTMDGETRGMTSDFDNESPGGNAVEDLTQNLPLAWSSPALDQTYDNAVPKDTEGDISSLLGLRKCVPFFFSSPEGHSKSELFLSTHVFSEALSSLPSHFDRRQLLDFCLSLKIISKESHSHLLQLETMTFPLDCTFLPASETIESFDNVLKLWNATEIIVQQLQLAAQYLKDEITDALLIILSFRISADHIQPLADCLSCSVPESSGSVSFKALQILWDWRDKEALHANCRTLVKAFLTSEIVPIDITRFVISYIKSEHQAQTSATSSSKNEGDEPSITQLRLNFAQSYVKVIEDIAQERIVDWLKVTSETDIHVFILKRCNWVNYDLLEELDNDLGNNKVFAMYVEQYKSTMKDFKVFQIPSQSIPAVLASGYSIFFILIQPPMRDLYSGSVLHEIKLKLSKKLNTEAVHILISGIVVDEASLWIRISIEEQILQKVSDDNIWKHQKQIDYDTL